MKLARWVSILAHPFVMAALMVGVGAGGRGALTVALFALVPVAILMVLQVRRGKWENVDASNVRERPVLYIVSALAMLALVAYLYLTHPGSPMVRGTLIIFGMIVICGILTRWIKISLHMTFASLCAASLLLTGSPVGWIVAAVVPLLAWSRVKLARHRPIEVALGVMIGIATALAIHI